MSDNTSSDQTIVPVILSGGVGSRLWPTSRAMYPKQLIAIASDQTMIQDTVERVRAPGFAAPIVICNEAHRFVIAQQLQDIGIADAEIILEPVGRNTAPAIVLAALVAAKTDPNATILVLPSDHVIGDLAAFNAAIETAKSAARTPCLVTFGIEPERPETGYGYIQAGAPLEGASSRCRAVRSFKEKPDLALAEEYIQSTDYFWNSGIFMLPVGLFLDEIAAFEPDILAHAQASLDAAQPDLDFIRIETESFAKCPALPIDIAVMERTEKAVVVPVSMQWNDLGSWHALWDIGEKDATGNVVDGDVMALNSKDCLLKSDKQLLATIGLDNVIVVATEDAILVAARDQVQEVKTIVAQLKEAERSEYQFNKIVHRPWGNFRRIDDGDGFQVKQIVVHPGGILSLQMHHHRAEHWIVVDGMAKVTLGDKEFILEKNQSTFIPLGTRHRLENPGDRPLRLIEVQSGDYLGEDDIVRFEDVYGRNNKPD